MSDMTPLGTRAIVIEDQPHKLQISIRDSVGCGVAWGCMFVPYAFVIVFGLLYALSDLHYYRSVLLPGLVALVSLYAAIASQLGEPVTAVNEVVIIDRATLVLRTGFSEIFRERQFEFVEVRNLRPRRAKGSPQIPNAVAFDYRGRTYEFGSGLSDHEIARLIKTIRARFPIQDEWDNE
jgi:hypothetical protein